MKILLAALLEAGLLATPVVSPAQMIADHSDDLLFQALDTCPASAAASREAHDQEAAGPYLRVSKIAARCAAASHGIVAGALCVIAIGGIAESVLTHNPDALTAKAGVSLRPHVAEARLSVD